MQNNKLFVGNLDNSVGIPELNELFSNYGKVGFVNIIEGKGFGFVEMSNQAEAENAMKELGGADFKGRKLRIDAARPKLNKRSGQK